MEVFLQEGKANVALAVSAYSFSASKPYGQIVVSQKDV